MEMILNNFLLGSNLSVAMTWSVTRLSTKLSCKIEDCAVQHGATAVMVVKKGWHSSTLDVVSDRTYQAFAFPVFKGLRETNPTNKFDVKSTSVKSVNATLQCHALLMEMTSCTIIEFNTKVRYKSGTISAG